MSRQRSLRLMLAVSVIAVVAACGGGAPAAPALTDPEEILTQSVASLKDVTTVEATGGLTGSVNAEGMGSFDLSNSTISAALDVPGKKGEFHFSAPTLLNSTLDAILLEDAAYYKVGGALAMLAGGASDKWIKSEIPEASGEPVTDPEEVDKAIDEFEAALDKLPNPPTKEADEKCGDQDCYHIKIAATAEELSQLSPEAASVGDGDLTLDLWVRKNDLRPGKLSVSVNSPETGNVGLTLDFKYDGPVSVEAPPADQVES